MIVKSFTSDTVAGALKLVRSELGGNAVILKTRKLDQAQRRLTGDKVEVTACIDTGATAQKMPLVINNEPTAKKPAAAPVAPQSPPPLSPHYPANEITRKLDFLIDIFQAPMRQKVFDGTLGQLFITLLRTDFPEKAAFDLCEKLDERLGHENDYSIVAMTAADLILEQLPRRRDTISFKPGSKVAMIGPAGAGKTSLMGRIAGYLVANKKLAVNLTSLDQVKVSAPEELATYADILDVGYFHMPRRVDCELLEKNARGHVMLIDTPAVNLRDHDGIALIAEKLERIRPDHIIAVFSATMRTTDVFNTIRAYHKLNLTDLAFTMTDQTSSLGGITAASIQSGLPVSIIGTGRKAGDINFEPDHRKIIQTCLGIDEEASDEQ